MLVHIPLIDCYWIQSKWQTGSHPRDWTRWHYSCGVCIDRFSWRLHVDCGICNWEMQCNGYNGDDVCFVQTFSFASVDPTIKLHQAQSTNLTSWTMPHRNLMLCTHTQSQLFSKKELSHIVSLKSNIWLLNKNIKQQHVRWYVISVLVAQSTIFGNNYLQHRVRYLANMNDHTGCFLWLVPP